MQNTIPSLVSRKAEKGFGMGQCRAGTARINACGDAAGHLRSKKPPNLLSGGSHKSNFKQHTNKKWLFYSMKIRIFIITILGTT